MAIRKRNIHRQPSTPAEIIKELYLADMTQMELAKKIHKASNGRTTLNTVRTKLSEVLNGKRKVSVEFSYLLSKALNTDSKMWINLQTTVDLYEVRRKYEG